MQTITILLLIFVVLIILSIIAFIKEQKELRVISMTFIALELAYYIVFIIWTKTK
jgi:hypothetical protein